MSFKRFLCLIVLGSFVVMGVAATGAKEAGPTTLVIVQPSEKTAIFDSLLPVIEKGLLADGLNLKLDVIFVPWSDLATKTQVMLAGQDQIDLMFDAPWLHMNQMIAQGYYEELTSLLNSYGPNILRTRPKEMWDANKFNGKIMGIPLGLFFQQPHGWVVRADLREKLGFAPLKTYDDIVKYAYAVKKDNPKMFPLDFDGNYSNIQYGFVNWKMLDDSDTNIRFTQAFPASLMLYYKNNDGVVHNMFEDLDPKLDTALKEARQFYQDGLINPDVLSIKDIQDDFYNTGKAAVLPVRLFSNNRSTDKLNNIKALGGASEPVVLATKTPGKVISNFVMDNFICVTKISKNKELAIKFLDWVNKNTDNYNLVEHGVKGKDWEPVGTDKWRNITGAEFGWQAYALSWNPLYNLLPESDDANAIVMQRLIATASYFVKDVTAGFSFNAEPVKNEIAQYQGIEGKYYPAMMNGVLDPTDTLAKFKDEAGPTLKTIQNELQKQVNDFLKANK
ncbi:MAG: extracellular solute-binding protein [Spirochaetia bacterium]|jgi:putative aldouronate transport system substrate-binding protein